MNNRTLTNAALAVTIALASIVACSAAQAQDVPAEYQEVFTILGKKGDYKANVLKVNIPRSDLKITIDGVAVPTSFGFGGWLAMTKGSRGNDVMMGDLVLLQEEVNPVMSALLENGLEVTALHNHFFWDNPKVYFMHVHGMGKPADLARKAKPAVDLIGHVAMKSARSAGDAAESRTVAASIQLQQTVTAGKLDTGALDHITGKTGEQLAGGVNKYTIGREDLKLKEMGATINARMGLNTWAAFFGSDDNAVVAGDIAMLEPEVTPVLKALRTHGIDVVAIHHHMTGSRPMIIFLHYWGKGRAVTLAEGFKAAVDELGKGAGKMEH